MPWEGSRNLETIILIQLSSEEKGLIIHTHTYTMKRRSLQRRGLNRDESEQNIERILQKQKIKPKAPVKEKL